MPEPPLSPGLINLQGIHVSSMSACGSEVVSVSGLDKQNNFVT